MPNPDHASGDEAGMSPISPRPPSSVSAAVTRADLIALASPPCHDCGEPVQRVEMPWHLDEDYRWRPGPYIMVCADGHRVVVEPLG